MESELKTYHVVILGICIILIFSLVINWYLLKEDASLSYRVESLEYRLYEKNLNETNACIDTVMLNSTCNIPHTLDSRICPQLNTCYKIFSDNEIWYKDW